LGDSRRVRAQQVGKWREHQKVGPRKVEKVRLVTTAATVPACISGHAALV